MRIWATHKFTAPPLLLSLFIPLLGIAAFATVPASTGCTTHQCDSDCVTLGGQDPQGLGYSCSITDPTPVGEYVQNWNTITWESSPIDGTWLDFPGQRRYFLWLPPAVIGAMDTPGRIVDVQTEIAITQTNPGWDQVINGSGQLAEWGINNALLEISNQSCAEYFLRVVVTVTVPPAPAPDGGP